MGRCMNNQSAYGGFIVMHQRKKTDMGYKTMRYIEIMH